MQVSIETTGQLERRLTITVENEKIDSAIEQRLKNLSRTVKLKGFRAGKVPLQMVQQYYGSQVRKEVLGDVMQSSFYEAIQQQQLRPAGYPSFEAANTTTGEGFKYVATFEIYPELQHINSGINVERPLATITDSDVDAMITTIRAQHHTWEEVARPAALGDRVVMDFNGSSEGKPIAGGQGKSYPVELGKGRMIDGFETGLVGVSANQERHLDLNFPAQYHAKELAGKPVSFAVKVLRVEASIPPADDSVLAKRLGVDDANVTTMRSEIRQNMQRELDAALLSKLKQNVMDGLLAVNPLEVPKSLVENEAQHLAEQMAENLQRQGMPKEQIKLQPSFFTEQAKRRVSLGLLLAEVIRQQKLQADKAKVRQKVESLAAPYERPQEVISWYYADAQRLAEIESVVLEEQVVDWILTQAKITEKTLSFNEVMNPQK
ncbi:MAG: trigger factor [Gammaproteobacteria bacterium]|nr:trigger factor [Gammaproteobacteria bacterium]